MKYVATLLFTILLTTCAPAQTLSLPEVENARLEHQRKAMLVLGGWAVGNIGLGMALRSRTEGSTRRFHEMNAIWNVVNLSIAGLSYFTLGEAAGTAIDGLQENGSFQKILLFNAGLDVGYVLGGLYLMERSRRPDADANRLKGHGRSIILQGGFLFLFDVANYLIAQRHDADYRLLLGGGGDGLGLLLTF
ncbi:DUF6992 family protein [Lewinella sp. IMCC34191]|uniref:DUF6992 family protein n=1 Tax=Lewinella sp. IMCC34191 TaxID=2259172 RepID=UPI0013007FA3|nr:hypothetical protein [Lewinella sp. IMCC34191]